MRRRLTQLKIPNLSQPKGNQDEHINHTETIKVHIIGLDDIEEKTNYVVGEIEETGNSPLENAKIKATRYYEAYHMPVFSCDTGLYFDNVPEEYQPGIHVRHVNGRCLTDDEMVAYYSSLAKKFGNLTARYRNAICFYFDETHIYESMDDSLSGKPFLLTDRQRGPIRKAGFPLDSLSVQIESGRYYYDIDDEIKNDKNLSVQKAIDEVALDDGFSKFFAYSLACRFFA